MIGKVQIGNLTFEEDGASAAEILEKVARDNRRTINNQYDMYGELDVRVTPTLGPLPRLSEGDTELLRVGGDLEC